MANIILFTDSTIRNIRNEVDPWYLEYSTYPAGAYAIASHLRHLGYSVLVIPHCSKISLAGVKKIINDNSKDLLWVGLSTTLFMVKSANLAAYKEIWNTTEELTVDTTIIQQKSKEFFNTVTELMWGSTEINAVAQFLKQQYNVPLLVGGAWVSDILNGNLVSLDSNVTLVTGRSELYVEEVTKLLAEKATTIPVSVDNSSYDDVGFKDRTFLWTEHDQLTSNDWLPVEVSRGCGFSCAYCNFDRKSTFDAYRNPKALREELIRNYEKFGVTKYMLMDDLYNDSKKKVRILYDEVWSKLPFKPEWTSYFRLDMFWSDPESALFIKESGARLGSFGIETLHDKAGSKVGKGLGKKRIIETLTMLKEAWKDDVLAHGMFIMGLPEEPEEHMLETIDWLNNTDLLYSYVTNSLWVTPPEHKKFVMRINSMAKDNSKYGISWLSENNWINQQGVTFQRASELAALSNRNKNRSCIGFAEYPELRKMNFTHQDIVNMKDTTQAELASRVLTQTINNKVNQFLNLKNL